MSEELHGSCLCGEVRFSYEGPIGKAAYCHCSDCRRTTGSAFNISVGLDAGRFRLAGIAPSTFTKTADSGNPLTRHFCPKCGSPVYTSFPAHPEKIYLKAGLINDASMVMPSHQSWLRSAVSWAFIDANLESFEAEK